MGSDYGNIPYEVEEITTWMDTYFTANLPGLIESSVRDILNEILALHPENYLFNYSHTYYNGTEYTNESKTWTHQFTSDAIDITDKKWLKIKVNLKGPGNAKCLFRVTDTDDNIISIFIASGTEQDITTYVDGGQEDYATFTGYLQVGQLTGDQTFKIWMQSDHVLATCYMDEFYIYKQL